VDLMLLHFPASMDASLAGGPAMRKEQWLALEAFAKAGKARAIGVSHYCPQHLQDVISVATLPIALNQVEYHVGMGGQGSVADDGRAFMERIGVKFMSFSPLCGPCGNQSDVLITGDLVTSIGRKYGKSGPQVALKWLVQQDIPVIPKTSNIAHLKQNIDLFSWTLSDEDMVALTKATSPSVTGGGDGVSSGDCNIEEMLFA
jgi:diketogulonate reductase-like aldo/keto reductase